VIRRGRIDVAGLAAMQVRGAEMEDVPAIAATIARVSEEGTIGTEPPVDLEERASGLRKLLGEPAPSAVWVLTDAGRVVGHASVRQRVVGVLSLGMALCPEARGRGGGRMLLERIVAHAEASGAHKLELEVWPDNARAIALYARAGFEFEGLRRAHYRRRDGSLRSSLIMARLLGDALG
jgi:RimJ/RimL family protein N-acetyltransferase